MAAASARCDPPGRNAHPRRRPGRHLGLERHDVGREDGQPARRSRSARWPSHRRTTASSTPEPARAHCRATATSATASSSRRTAATRGRTSRATTSTASRCRGSSSTRTTRTTSGSQCCPRPWWRQAHQPARHSRFGIWESKDGGVYWTLLMGAPSGSNGATDLELDPHNGDLYASFWGRRHLQEHQRRHELEDDHERAAGARTTPRNRRASRSPSRIPPGQPNATLYTGYRLDRRTGLPLRRGVQVDQRRRELGELPGGALPRQRRGLLRHAPVLVRQRDRGRSRRIRTSFTPAGVTTTRTARAASTARPTAARRGSTSATTSTPTSTRSRSTRRTRSAC